MAAEGRFFLRRGSRHSPIVLPAALCLSALLFACGSRAVDSGASPEPAATQIPSAVPAPPPPGLVDITTVIPDIELDVRYATENNFTGEVLDGYRAARVFLRPKTARALAEAWKELADEGLHLKIFDGYRPLRAERHMARWARAAGREDLIRDGLVPAGVSSGRKFGHACGNAVDLTLVDARGNELDMGTDFDDFTRASWTDAAAGPARENRSLLKTAMERAGFRNFSREWWHFNYRGEPGRALDYEIR